MGRVGGVVLTVLASAATFYVLADQASVWGGDLVPNPMWLATASVTVIALAVGRALRPWALVGGLVGVVTVGLVVFDESLRGVITPSLGNSAESIVITYGVLRLLGERPRINRTRDAMALIAIIVVGCAVGGLIAVLDTTSNVISDDRFDTWWRWTFGDVVGEVHLVPLVLFAGAPIWFRARRLGVVELVVFAMAAGVGGVAAFASDSSTVYLLVPVALWMSIRFGPMVASCWATASALLATIASGRGVGPFVEFGAEPVLDVQAFNIAIGVSALIGGAHALRAHIDRVGLLESEVRWRRLGEAAFEGIARVDDAGRLVETNQVFADLVGVDHVDVLGKRIRDVVRDTDWDRLNHHRARFASGSGSEFEIWAADATEERRWLRVTTRPFPDGGGFIFLSDISDERHERLQRLAAEHRLATVEQEQRNELAQQLHDGPVQQLAAAIVRISTFRKSQGDHPDLELSQEIIERSVDHLRGTLHTLSLGNVTLSGLRSALEASLVPLRAGVDPDVTIDLDPELRLPDHVTRTVFELVREAAANAMIHANATNVVASVRVDGDHIVVEVCDDGSGFDVRRQPEGTAGHLGVRLMRSRAAELGSPLVVESTAGAGTVVSTRFRHPAD